MTCQSSQCLNLYNGLGMDGTSFCTGLWMFISWLIYTATARPERIPFYSIWISMVLILIGLLDGHIRKCKGGCGRKLSGGSRFMGR